ASAVLFYVSYWLFAKREAARWMAYLRSKAGGGQAAASIFGISFLAVYREAFETILFYQPLMAEAGTGTAAHVGAPPCPGVRRARFSAWRYVFSFEQRLLYALAVVFAATGIAAVQTSGPLPLHPLALPHVPALGIYPTIEPYVVQTALVALAVGAGLVLRYQ